MGQKWSKRGPKCPKWVQNGPKMGPKRVPKGVKKGSKRGSQNGSPRGWNKKKKVEKYFLSGPTMGVYTGPPPLKNTILGRYQPLRPCSRRISEKSAAPPADGPAGGISPLFFRFRRQQGLAGWHRTEKLVKTGVTPFLSAFLAILGQSGPNR